MTAEVLTPPRAARGGVLRSAQGRARLAAVVCYVVGGASGLLVSITTTAGELTPATAEHSALAILLNNLGVLAWLALGLLTMGVLSFTVLLFNGMLLGWVIGKSAVAGTLSSVATGVLPHLLPELTAYVLSAAASTTLGIALARGVLRRRPPTADAWRTWWRLQAVSATLLAVGAVVERYVSHV